MMPKLYAIITRAMACAAVLFTTALIVSSRFAVLDAQRPRASPHESVSGSIGGADLTITYGRPYMRGRVIFGSLVPYDRVWCPGADEATVLTSSKPITLRDSLTIPPGPHTIWMLPTADAWTLIVSREPSGFHTRYHASADLGRMPLDKRMLDAPVDQLTFAFRKNGDRSGVIVMSWERTEVSVPFTVTGSGVL
jgi:Protein of unknown function (DUF2911)